MTDKKKVFISFNKYLYIYNITVRYTHTHAHIHTKMKLPFIVSIDRITKDILIYSMSIDDKMMMN
jgi:hypothetical protein